MSLGKEIRKARGDRPRKEVAEKLGISPQQLSRIEVGSRKPSISLLARIVAELKMDPAAVLSLENDDTLPDAPSPA